MKFVLLTEHKGCGHRFPYDCVLEATSWEDARKEVQDLLANQGYWINDLSIGMPVHVEILEVATSEQVTIME